MALRDRIKGALARKKPEAEAPDEESELKQYSLDRNQCWALLMTRVDSAHELTEHDWFADTIQSLIDIEMVQILERGDKTVWRLTGLGENITEYLAHANVRLTIDGNASIF